MEFFACGGAVAASNAATLSVRSSGEFVLSLENLIAELRVDGFRIGALMVSAHHGLVQQWSLLRRSATPQHNTVKSFGHSKKANPCLMMKSRRSDLPPNWQRLS